MSYKGLYAKGHFTKASKRLYGVGPIGSGVPRHPFLQVECDELQPLSLTRAFSGRKRCACDSEAKDYSDYSPVSEGESFRVGDCFLRVLLTPGHSSDSISLVLEQVRPTSPKGSCVLRRVKWKRSSPATACWGGARPVSASSWSITSP